MANINSVRTTANILQNKRVVDMAKDIALLDPKVAPFFCGCPCTLANAERP